MHASWIASELHVDVHVDEPTTYMHVYQYVKARLDQGCKRVLSDANGVCDFVPMFIHGS